MAEVAFQMAHGNESLTSSFLIRAVGATLNQVGRKFSMSGMLS